MVKTILVVAVALGVSGAAAQERPAAGVCAGDIESHCATEQMGEDRVPMCMKEQIKNLSAACRQRLARFAVAQRQACRADIHRLCAGVTPRRIRNCVQSSLASLSDACQDAVMQAVFRRL